MDNRHTFQASQVFSNSHMNGSSSYRVPPSASHPVQPAQLPIMSIPSIDTPAQQPVYRDNRTGLTYSRDQMLRFIWRQDPQNGKFKIRQTEGLFKPGSYTDMTTLTRYTHQEMIDLTGNILVEHLSRSRPQLHPFQAMQGQQHFQQQTQSQMDSSMQSSMQPSLAGYSPRGYTDGQAIRSQQSQGIRDERSVEQQARMAQPGQGQQPLPQQQVYPPTQPSSHVANAGQPGFVDEFGRQWSRAQYEELVRRQQAQKAQASAAMSSGLGPQFQQAQQTSPPMMMNSQASLQTNNMHYGMAPQEHSDLLQRQKGNMGPPPVPVNPGAQQQRQYVPPPGTKSLQQSPINDQSGRPWTREQWEKVEKSREVKKNLVPPSQATKGSVPGSPLTQPAVHKQRVNNIQKQPFHRPVSSVAQPKKPSVMQPAKQAAPSEVKVTGKDITNRSLNPTATSTSLAPVVPQSNQPDQVSMSKQSNIAPNTAPAPAPSPTPAPTQPTTVTQWDVENGRRVYDSMTSFVSSRQKAYHDGLAKLDAATTTSNPPANVPVTNTPTASALPPFDPSIFATVKHPKYTGFNHFSELNGGDLADVDNQELLKRICTVDPDGALRAPEPRWMTEERAKLEWEIYMLAAR
ncbi:hypothetical protein COCC4DRAFT_58056 [Bipolaris maydis ATCC 48331]|uniref:Uncharacterized protein n=2 Tax=Cochliobolus heterostrophus TaxID=5016 RepID=M2U1R5_COCH5|nr:uncharacterized protein COCC4DRAFT_58056 [Bipolaris maydis ATCC 48331]EMD92499.1 hypothetical protein COCHEDRAFT_1029942 [Bipolaris maydis C5]KAH7552924.1 hypothetical protein BM1_07897 [Bipolaris maydis]ENI08194.1 hypothetical protein COCC4DRAFT_58056 [Bipolaris maydis ATCC 48331]KAJ5022318.1 hypothetical protein J3E73DRAFT_197580 [Bipolaris maydis]KAJ5061015.1 hypothetical protein J3E74DRAFT_405880 [Bipolaris maydis]